MSFVLWFKYISKPDMVMHGFHLGLQIKVAKDIAESKFHAANNLSGNPSDWVSYVELRQGGKVIGRFDGETWEMRS